MCDIKLNKEICEDTILEMFHAYMGGHADALVVKIKFKEIRDLLDQCEKELEDSAIVEADKWNGQIYEGYKIEFGQSGRYTYDHHEEYAQLKNRMKYLEENMKMAYKSHSKGSGFGITTIIDEHGEEFPCAVYTPSKAYVKLVKQKGA